MTNPPRRGRNTSMSCRPARSERDAESMKARLALAGFESVIQRVEIRFKGTHYRVRMGPYQSRRKLQLHKKQLARQGINTLAIRLDPAE